MQKILLAGLFTVLASGFASPLAIADTQPAPTPVISAPAGQETLVLAGGCFWGIQGVFEHVKGVTNTVAGYAGGTLPNPTYEQVGSETTGHAESVKITYDPKQVSADQLLQVFFAVHNPTELNRQGPDAGNSYRTEVFYTTPEQQQAANAIIKKLTDAKTYDQPIVTKVEALNNDFYPAEGYHQHFLDQNPSYPYIVINDLPKVETLKTQFPALYSPTPM